MRYFLGYIKEGKNHTIDLRKIVDNPCHILNIIKFTCSFINMEELNKFLIEKNKIEEPVYLVYLKEQSKYKSYTKAIHGMYYKQDERYFNIDTLYNYLKSNILDYNLFNYIYLNYLKDNGFFNYLKSNIIRLSSNPLFIEQYLNRINTDYISLELKELIQGLNKIIISHYDNERNILSIATIIKDSDYINLIESIVNLIDKNIFDAGDIFNVFKDKVAYKDDIVIKNSLTLLHRIERTEEVTDELLATFQRFFETTIYDYDYKKKTFKYKEGTKVLNEMAFINLGINTLMYVKREEVTKTNELMSEDTLEEVEEEFLELSDFGGDDPSEWGYYQVNKTHYRRK